MNWFYVSISAQKYEKHVSKHILHLKYPFWGLKLERKSCGFRRETRLF